MPAKIGWGSKRVPLWRCNHCHVDGFDFDRVAAHEAGHIAWAGTNVDVLIVGPDPEPQEDTE